MSSRKGVTITCTQLEERARHPLSDEEVARIGEAIPCSSIPEVIGDIAFALEAKGEAERSEG